MVNLKKNEVCFKKATEQELRYLLKYAKDVTNGNQLVSSNGSADHSTNKSEVSNSFDKVTPLTKLQIWKNISIMSFAFFCIWTSFTSLSDLQSSINRADDIGTMTLTIIYTTLVVSYSIVGNPVISKFGCKWSMVTASAVYIYHMAVNIYPTWLLMISSGFLVGIAAAPLWTGFTLYCTQMSTWLAELTEREESVVLVFSLGVFYTVFNTSKIIGNLLSSVVLDYHHNNSMNEMQPSYAEIKRCIGNQNVTLSKIATLERPDDSKVYILCGVWVSLCFLGVVSLLLVDNICLDVTQKDEQVTHKMLATIQHLWNSRTQKIILPLSIYSGMLQGFITADFIRSFVACALGIESTGYIMACNGFGLTISSALLGHCGKFIGHIAVFTTAFVLAFGLQTTLLIWRPTVDSSPVLYTIAALLGVVVCILKTQLTAFYGHLFHDNVEAGYGNYYSFESIGLAVSFSYSSYICTQWKLYILQGLLFVSIVAYYTVEYMERHKHDETSISIEAQPLKKDKGDID